VADAAPRVPALAEPLPEAKVNEVGLATNQKIAASKPA